VSGDARIAIRCSESNHDWLSTVAIISIGNLEASGYDVEVEIDPQTNTVVFDFDVAGKPSHQRTSRLCTVVSEAMRHALVDDADLCKFRELEVSYELSYSLACHNGRRHGVPLASQMNLFD
jgi:hypothetical protein